MKIEVRRIDPLQLGIVLATVYAFFSLIYVVFFLAIAMLSDQAPLMIVQAILFPIFAVVGGFIGGVIMGFIYNVAASLSGGVKLEFYDSR